jgi:hypothetical protein
MRINIWGSLREEFRKDPILIVVEIIGTVASIVAAVVLSFNLMSVGTVYYMWVVGSVCLTFTSYRRKNSLLTGLMVFYTILNIIGLWNFA